MYQHILHGDLKILQKSGDEKTLYS